MNSKLTLNVGLRCDVYVPWVEVDDRQSNFDETTGTFVVASDNATIDGVNVGRYLQTYSKGDCRTALRLRLRPDRHRPHARPRRRSACSGTSRRAGRRRRRRRTRRSCSRRRSRRRRTRTSRPNLQLSRRACRRPRASTRPGRPRGPRARSSTPTSATPTRVNWNLNVQQQLGTNYMVELAYVGLARPPVPAARATRTRRRRPWACPTRTSTGRSRRSRRRCARSGRSRARRSPRLPRLARQVPAALRQRHLVPELLHLREG